MPDIPSEYISGVQHRAAELVAVDPDEGTFTGIVAPYGVEGEIAPKLWEVFERGAFAAAVNAPGRIKVMSPDHTGVVIGHATELRDQATGLEGTFRISRTIAGLDTLTLLRDDVLTELSCEFVPLPNEFTVEKRGGGALVRHRRSRLVGVSPVRLAAYEDAQVLSVRDASAKEREQTIARLRALTS